MSLKIHHNSFRFTCFPRVSGDEPTISDKVRQLVKFSPRERG